MATTILVPFQGDGSGAGELTWGQQDIWAAMQAQQSSLPLGGATELLVAKDIDFFVDSLRFMMSRHHSLRTRLRFEPDGTTRQVLADHGDVPLCIVDVPDDGDPAAVTADVHADYMVRDFDYENEWPIRMAVIRHRAACTHVVAVYCHIVMDAEGFAVLLADLANFGLGADAPPITATQPLALAALQRSPAGQRLNKAAQRHWRRQLAKVSARRFADTDDERTPRHWQVTFRSPAAYVGLHSVVARTGTEASTVLLAAVAVALADVTGRNPTVLRVIVNNRFRPGLAEAVSPLAQTGLCIVDVADVTFDEVVERAGQGTTGVYFNAYYHPTEMTDLLAELGRERGEDIDLGCFFNDRRAPEHREPTGPPPTPEDLSAAAESTVQWGPFFDRPFERFFCHVNDIPDTLELVVYTDTRYVPPDDIAAFFRAFESILIAAAFDPKAPIGV